MRRSICGLCTRHDREKPHIRRFQSPISCISNERASSMSHTPVFLPLYPPFFQIKKMEKADVLSLSSLHLPLSLFFYRIHTLADIATTKIENYHPFVFRTRLARNARNKYNENIQAFDESPADSTVRIHITLFSLRWKHEIFR